RCVLCLPRPPFPTRRSSDLVGYQWFSGTTALAGETGQTLVVRPAATSTYWVRATNSCGASIDSDTITIAVTPCDAPAILVQPVRSEEHTSELQSPDQLV